MALRNTDTRWGSVAKWLHWSIAFFMIAAMTCSIWAAQLDPEIAEHRRLWPILIMQLHKPLGFTALVLIVVRVVWTLTGRRPRLPNNMSAREVFLSKAAHIALYALMLIVPFSGWFMSQYADSTVNYFGLFEIDNLVAANKERVGQLHPVHVYLGLFTLALVVFHIAAALFHQYVRRDDVLVKMLPESQNRES